MEATTAGSSPPESAPGAGFPGVTHYRHNGVHVTDRWLVCGGRRYAIAELTNTRTVRAPLRPVTVTSAIAASGVAVVIVVAGRFLDSAGWIGAAVVLCVPLLLFAVSLTQHRPYEMWAEYHNLTVQLLWEENSERYRRFAAP